MTITTCDICGKEMPTLPKGDNFEIVSHGKIWDVCDDCRQELNKWIESKHHQYAFCECIKSECPFYNTSWAHKTVEHCRRTESEDKE